MALWGRELFAGPGFKSAWLLLLFWHFSFLGLF